MIFGVGADLVAVDRLEKLWQRHGVRALEKMLAPEERLACQSSSAPGRFLAKRFAAKEALGKALGTGISQPVLLSSIAVVHDPLGKPAFSFAEELQNWMGERQLHAHLSISDEVAYALAFVVVERT